MKIRILSAVIGSAVLIAIIAFSDSFPILINLLIAIASLVCVTELLSAKKMLKNFKLSVPSMLFSVALPMLITTSYWQILIAIYVIILFAVLLKFNTEISFPDIAFDLVTTSLISFGLSTIIILCNTNIELASFYIVLALALPWMADGGAYFVGSAMGKKKLCPNISPKKTVEGAIGGIIIGTFTPILVIIIFQTFFFHFDIEVNFFAMAFMGLIATITSIIGDLSFSLIKRSCQVKDYGTIIPGHGGILDRCDSVIFSAPVIFIFVNYFSIIMIEGV